jgi:hypothetical protein
MPTRDPVASLLLLYDTRTAAIFHVRNALMHPYLFKVSLTKRDPEHLNIKTGGQLVQPALLLPRKTVVGTLHLHQTADPPSSLLRFLPEEQVGKSTCPIYRRNQRRILLYGEFNGEAFERNLIAIIVPFAKVLCEAEAYDGYRFSAHAATHDPEIMSRVCCPVHPSTRRSFPTCVHGADKTRNFIKIPAPDFLRIIAGN